MVRGHDAASARGTLDPMSTRRTSEATNHSGVSPFENAGLRDVVVVATMTWARSAAEEKLLVRSIAALSELGLPIVAAGRDTSHSLRGRLEGVPGLQLTSSRAEDLTTQVTHALASAMSSGRPWILYTEPDKEQFFREGGASRFLERALSAPTAPEEAVVSQPGVIIAARSAGSLATYPPIQRYTEGVFNHLCEQVLRVPGDYCYGPFLMRRDVAAALDLKRELGWGWRPRAFRKAQQLGSGLAIITDDYPCPADQREEDDGERIHRMRQLSQNIHGLTV